MCSMDPVITNTKVKKLIYNTPYPSNHLINKAVTMATKKGFPGISDILGVLSLIHDICDYLLLDEGMLHATRCSLYFFFIIPMICTVALAAMRCFKWVTCGK